MMQSKRLGGWYHNMSVLLEAGVPILKTIQTSYSSARGGWRSVLIQMERDLSQGEGLSQSMSRRPRYFPPLDVAMTEAAELSGNLPEVFRALGEWHDLQRRMIQTILSGMIFPAAILFTAAWIGPFPPMILGAITFSQYLMQVLMTHLVFLVPMFVVTAIIKWTPPHGPARLALDGIVLCIPVLGHAVRSLTLSRFFLSFHLMIKSGMPIVQILDTATRLMGNHFIRQWFIKCQNAVREGRPLSEGFSPSLPAEYRELWLAGEESGNLDTVSRRIATFAAERAEFLFQQFSSWLPKIIYGLVCLYMIYLILKSAGAVAQKMGSIL